MPVLLLNQHPQAQSHHYLKCQDLRGSGIPPDIEEVVTHKNILGEDNIHPSVIAARPPQRLGDTITSEQPSRPSMNNLTSPNETTIWEATLVGEAPSIFHVTYHWPGPVYNAVQTEENNDEPLSLPCWKRYQRSVCIARSLVIGALVVALAVSLTGK